LLSVRSLSMALAGTDREHHRHFAGAAEQYRRSLVEIMNNSLLPVQAGADAFAGRADSTLWRQVPDFDYRAPGVSWVLVRQRLPVAMLVLWVIMGATLAVVAVRRLNLDAAERPA
jgi:ABC-2 type transport system permease protein